MSADDPQDNRPPPLYVLGIPQSEEERGKCRSCGFLWAAAFDNSGERKFRDIRVQVRYGSDPFRYEVSMFPTHERPVCILGVANLQDEIAQKDLRDAAGKLVHEQGQDFPTAAGIIFKKPRHCQEWVAYSEGKTIQQYYAEAFMERLERLRQQFQIDGEKRQQVWEAKLSESQSRLQEQTNRIVEAILATARDHKEITAESKTIAEGSLAAVAESKEIAKTSLTAVTAIGVLGDQFKVMAEKSDNFMRNVNLWLLVLTIVILFLTAAGVYRAFVSRPPTVIIQQPGEQQPGEQRKDNSTK